MGGNAEQVAMVADLPASVQAKIANRAMLGRTMITSAVEKITKGNVIDVVTKAFAVHEKNAADIKYLWNYFKGDQPVLQRTRELRDELTQHIVENRANQIVAFKVGYVAGEPIQYISTDAEVEHDDDGFLTVAKNSSSASVEIAKLNNVMRLNAKHTKDKELIKWLYICGVGYRLIEQNRFPYKKIPFNLYTLDPQQTFVIHSSDHTKRPLAGVYYIVNEDREKIVTIVTPEKFFTWKYGTKNVEEAKNNFGMIPIIEYQANMERQGCFEIVLPLLDAINDFDSDRLEAVEQFVQSLLVLYNCQVEEGTTADSIRKAGMILLKSVGENKADVKNLSEQLDQSQNQALKDDLYNAVLEIVGMPGQSNGNTGDSSNNGAVILKNGWQGAETRAKDLEAEFKQPEMEMMWLLSAIAGKTLKKNGGFEFDPANVDIKFSRHNYENLLSKSQTLVTMLGNDKIDPKYAYEASGLFMDTEEAYRAGMAWYAKMLGLAKTIAEVKEERDAAKVSTEEAKVNTDAK